MIRRSRLLPYRLPLKQAWCSARGSFKERQGCLLELTDEDGRTGYGDCAPLVAAGTEFPGQALRWLTANLAAWHGLTLEAALQQLERVPPGLPATRCALELALLDLQAQQSGLGLAALLNPDAALTVPVNAVLTTMATTAVAQGLCANSCSGITVFKVKVGMQSAQQEIQQLKRLCASLPTQARLRLDANGAWNTAEALSFIDAVTDLPIESLEEPLAHPTHASLQALQHRTPFPLALDESLSRFCADKGLADYPVRRLILKPMVRGGVRPALALAQLAHAAALDTVVTTTVDSAVGVYGALHLAAALGMPAQPLAHGLTTGDWLAADLAAPPRVEQGKMHLPGGLGLGVVLTLTPMTTGNRGFANEHPL